MSRSFRVFLLGVGAVMVLNACRSSPSLRGPEAKVEAAAHTYLAAWGAGDVSAQLAATVDPPPDFENQHHRWRQSLGVEASRVDDLHVRMEGEARASVTVELTHVLRGLGEWRVETSLKFERRDGRWWLRWAPEVLHPLARPGDSFARTRIWGPRAPLLDAAGDPLTLPGEVIQIGVELRRVKDQEAVADALRREVGVSPSRVRAALRARGVRPETFLPFVDLRPKRYAQVRPLLAPVPGVVFRRKESRLSPSEGFAAHVLGRVGDATAERLAELGMPYQVGDVVGISGLERSQERTLAGTPSGEVRLVRAAGQKIVLHRFEGRAGEPVRTTLRRDVQGAVEAALSTLAQPGAFVVLDARTGAVIAAASRPLGEALNRAFVGRYPPGSTFKVVTAEALLRQGLTPGSRVDCSASTIVGGKRFGNIEGLVPGETTLLEAFAQSCNTTFVALTPTHLKGEPLLAAAHRFGFDAAYSVGLPSHGGLFPMPSDDAEWAAAALGQGRVVATPLHMASVAAAVAHGVWRAPTLLETGTEGPEFRLSRGIARPLQTLMRAVVQEGTGRRAADLTMLMGKTGTAEFGTAQPPAAHAWFIGLHGDLALAVVVEGGGAGGRVAVPIVKRFAEELSGAR